MSKHPETTKHNYLDKIAACVSKRGIDAEHGDILHVTIKHDDWCNALTNKRNKLCNCDAELVTFDD